MFLTYLKKVGQLLLNPTTQRIILGCLLILFITLFLNQCDTTKQVKQQAKQNQEALKDDIKIIKDNVGNLVIEKTAYQTSLKDLKEFNKELYEEVKKMKGQVLDLSKITVKFIDTLPKMLKSNVQVETDDKKNLQKYTINWDYKDSVGSLKQSIEGVTKLFVDKKTFEPTEHTVIFNKRQFDLELIVGHEKYDGYINVFVKPKYITQGLNLNVIGTRIDNSITPVKDKKFDFGITFGVGFGGPINELKLYPGVNWTIGLGVTYSLFKF